MPIYELADWAALQEQIKAGGQAVSGLTAAEAQAALNTQVVTTQSGSNLYVYNPANVPSPQPPIQFPGTSAPQASADFVAGGGMTNASGAAVAGSEVVAGSNVALTQTASGATGVAGVLSMNLPTAAAAIAPLAGVALGVGLYELNPDLWETISRALLPFCYPDTNLTPVMVDENGNTYFSEEEVNAVKKALAEISYPIAESDPFDFGNQVVPYPFRFVKNVRTFTVSYEALLSNVDPTDFVAQTVQVIFSSPVNLVRAYWGSDYDWFDYRDESLYVSSSTEFTLTQKIIYNPKPSIGAGFQVDGTHDKFYSYNGKVVCAYELEMSRWRNVKISIDTGDYITVLHYGSNLKAGRKTIGWVMEYGQGTGYPEGISGWTGSDYPLTPTTLNVITGIKPDGSVITLPYYPITTPVGEPGTSVDPTEFPDLTDNPDPSTAIDPWITNDPDKKTYPPNVEPWNPADLPGQIPNYMPKLDPNADPSQLPEEDTAEEEKEKDDKKDSGESPKPQIPLIPTLPSAASGLLHVYNPNQTEIDSFGSWLWSTFSGDLIDTLSKLFNDPMDAVIGLHELYATPAITGRATIRAGFLDSGVGANLVGERYTTINCGSVVVPEYYQNYLDYSPYTKCFIYLPFVGIVPVSADDIIGNAVNITYNIDAYNGCCIAIVTVARAGYSSTVYQFEGNCGVEIPITSGYQSVLMGGLLGIAGTAITGSPHVGLAAASLGRANLGKNEVSHSGSFGSSYGAMGAKIPYIIVKRPTQKSVVNYNEEYGFPAHKRVKIGDCKGYLRAREIHVISPTATDDEKARIEGLLKEGVFVQ